MAHHLKQFAVVIGLVESQTESPTENVATGKLNQFKGFYTPRPFPSNAQFRSKHSALTV